MECILCEQYNKQQIICKNCYKLLTPIGHACKYCSKPLISKSQNICSECQKEPPAYTKMYTKFQYEEPLKMLIHKFKYHNSLYLTSLLTEIMLKAPINYDEVGLIIPVPLSKNRIRQRGYNQAAILAKSIAKKLKAPYSDNYLRKIIDTPNQVEITGEHRRKNLKNAFIISPKYNYQTVTIIDDIFTTGSTANEIALTLKANGVNKVNVWCCARAITK